MEIINRILTLARKKGIKQSFLNEQIGGYRGKITEWKNNKSTPTDEELKIISKCLDTTVDYLLGKTDDPNLKNTFYKSKGFKIPVIGNVAAGIPIEAIEDIIDYEEIDENMAKRGTYFGLRIKGNSMEPRMHEGDIVIVRKQQDVENGETAIVLVNCEDAACKKIIKHDTGISLVSTNPVYEPMFYTFKEIEELPVTILGKVVELRAKF